MDIIVKTNAEMAYQFAARAPEAFRLMALPAIEEWIIHVMDVYDKQGLYPGCSAFGQLQTFAAENAEAAHSITLDEIHHVLELFVQGLAGRPLKVEASSETYTDTATLFLPARLYLFAKRQDNFRLYKAMAAHLWAQTWYGSFRLPPGAAPLTESLVDYRDTARALRLFHALETVRLNARIGRELPGLYRDMLEVQQLIGEVRYPDAWKQSIQRDRNFIALGKARREGI